MRDNGVLKRWMKRPTILHSYLLNNSHPRALRKQSSAGEARFDFCVDQKRGSMARF